MKAFLSSLLFLLLATTGFCQAQIEDFLNGQVSGKNIFLEYDYAAMLDSIDALNLELSSIDWGVYTQIRESILGEHPLDESGWSVAVSNDGQIIAIGGLKNDDAGANSGHVRVYSWEESSAEWQQMGLDINGLSAGDGCGRSVSLSADGTVLAVGANGNDSFASNSGHTRVFSWDGSDWQQMGLDIYGELSGDYSGFSVSLAADGNSVAIGSPTNGTATNGTARVFGWDGDNLTWSQVGANINGEDIGDQFGVSVSLSSDGSILSVGASLNDGSGVDAGHVRIYELTNSNAWSQLGGDIDGELTDDRSGYSVSLSADGSKVAVGAVKNDDNGDRSGHVKVYQWNTTSEEWDQLGMSIPGEAAYDWSGWSVALSLDGNRLAISSTYNDDNGTNAGHVRVYSWDVDSGAWLQYGDDIDGEVSGDESGWSVDLSADGNVLVIGSPGNDDNGTDSGHVRIMVAN